MTTNGGAPPPDYSRYAGLPSTTNFKTIGKIAGVIGVIAVVIIALSVIKTVYTDWLWFDKVGILSVYKTILGTRIWLFFGGAVLAAIVIAANLHLAHRFSRGESTLPVPPEVIRFGRIAILVGAALTVFIAAIVFGAVAQGRWETILIFMNRVPFGIEDPQFSKDMSFHVAVMPILHFVQGWVMGLVIAAIVTSAVLYLVNFGIRGLTFGLTPRLRTHLAVLGAVLMLTISVAHYLDIYELVFSGRGAAPGAGYTDVNARVPVLWLLVAISLVSAVGFAASIFYGGGRLMVAAFTLWAVIAIVAGVIYPSAFQRLRVAPNEFVREEQYIDRAIVATRDAYNLNLIEETVFDYEPSLDSQTIVDNEETVRNIRLWDHRPLLDTYNQIQTFRQYYNFVGVDVDRYRFQDGELQQVMLAARELFPERLEEDAQNWVNRTLAYTHGFGVTVSPVSSYTDEGRPEFFVEGLPPVGDLTVDRPEIYFGENTSNYVVVDTETREFDFPGSQGEPVLKNYEGDGGVALGSFFRRAAFAWRFLDFNLLISGELSSGSKVMFHREITERVSVMAPFLKLDSDPYIVVGDGGKLWWIIDAYTTTDRYAYSQRFEDYNYIRNSVKVVVDAYNGDVHFLVREPNDPMIQMYRNAFPDLFQDFDAIDQLDPSLREHIRYGFDLFQAQSDLNLRYHMKEPQKFFLRDDLWARAREVFDEPTNTQDIEPYYIIMKLPGEENVEYVLLLPFTPAGEERKNMVGWMAARSDGENYGKLITFLFPKGQVDGPEQIEGRITSDEDIGRELSLLCPEGKVCVRGNLLAIPMQVAREDGSESQTLLYVEPLYIRAENLPLPELKKVIVADNRQVVMSDTLEESLCILVNGAEACADTLTPQIPTRPTTPTDGVDVPQPTLSLEAIDAIISEIENLEGSVEGLLESLERLRETIERMQGDNSDQ